MHKYLLQNLALLVKGNISLLDSQSEQQPLILYSELNPGFVYTSEISLLYSYSQQEENNVPGYQVMCYLIVCVIGHTPHSGYYRERSCVLIGAWLPGDWLIYEGAANAAGGYEYESLGQLWRFSRGRESFHLDINNIKCQNIRHNFIIS